MSGRVRLPARGASTTPLLSVLVVLVIMLLSVLAVASPALLADGRTATIHRGIAEVPDLTQWPRATAPGLPEFGAVSDPDAGVWRGALAAVEQVRRAQPTPLRDLLGAPRLTVTVEPAATVDENPHRTTPVPLNRVSLVSDPGLAQRSALVEGRMPEPTAPQDGVEIVLTKKVASRLAWAVGDQRRSDGMTLTLVGVVVPSGRDDGDWTFISGSAAPVVEVEGGGNSILVGAAFMHVDEAALLTDHVTDMKVSAWMPFRSDGVDVANAERVSAQLRLLSADPVPLPMHGDAFYNRGLQFHSALPQALDAGVSRANAMTPVVTVAAVGPMTVALVVLALMSRLIAVRRVDSVRVLRARGASLARLITLLGVEGALLGVLGATVGACVAAAWLGLEGAWVLAVPAVLAIVPAVSLPWGALATAAERGRHDLGERARGGAGRIAADVVVLGLTALLIVLVATREPTGAADPMLLTLTVLLSVSATVLTLHALPPLLRLAERRGRRAAALAPLLGPARAGRESAVRTAPVLSAVAGIGVAVFSLAFATTVSSGIVRAADAQVGADVRVDAAYITDDAASAVADLDGVAAMAATQEGSNVQASAGAKKVQARVHVVDRAAFTRVQQGRESGIPLPPALGGDGDGPVPVVISQALQDALDGASASPKIGRTPVRVVGVAPSEVPFGAGDRWLIVDIVNARALGQDGTGFSQLYLDVAPGADADRVGAAAVRAIGSGAVFTTPQRVEALHADDPGYGVLRGALLVASALVAGLLVLAVTATLALGAASRARMMAVLRALGSPRRAAGRLVAWEVTPALLLSLPFGVGAGAAMSALVIPQLDLRGFVGGAVQPAVSLGGVWTVLAVAGFALIAAIAVAVSAGLASRMDPAAAVRAGDERVP